MCCVGEPTIIRRHLQGPIKNANRGTSRCILPCVTGRNQAESGIICQTQILSAVTRFHLTGRDGAPTLIATWCGVSSGGVGWGLPHRNWSGVKNRWGKPHAPDLRLRDSISSLLSAFGDKRHARVIQERDGNQARIAQELDDGRNRGPLAMGRGAGFQSEVAPDKSGKVRIAVVGRSAGELRVGGHPNAAARGMELNVAHRRTGRRPARCRG